MRIFIKVRFDAQLPKFEKILDKKYILYLPFPQDHEAEKVITEIIAKKLSVREEDVYFVMIDKINGWVFDIDA
jgi:hypothetical protein